MGDGHMPHRFPHAALDADWLVAWVCQECGKVIREYGASDPGDRCPVDWRNGSAGAGTQVVDRSAR